MNKYRYDKAGEGVALQNQEIRAFPMITQRWRALPLLSLFFFLIQFVSPLPAQGIPDLSYPSSDVGKIIGRMDKDNGLLPKDGNNTLGVVQVLFHKGYMIAPAARNAARRGNGSTRGSFVVFDISDPRDPKRVFFRQDDVTNNLREQHGHLIFHREGRDYFVGNAIKGIQIWDVTDPSQPSLVSDFQAPSMNGGGGTYQSTGWWVGGAWPYLYLGVPERGYITIDVTDPANPVDLGFLIDPDIPNHKGYSHKTAFSLVSVGSVHTVGNQMVLGNAGGTANGGANSGQFATVDISDPLHPKAQDRGDGVGNYSVGFYGNFVTMHGGRTLQAWDISTPSDVRRVTSRSVADSALYSAFQDKFYQGPMFNTYHKQHFDWEGTPSFNHAGVRTARGPISKTYEFVSVVGNLVVGAGGGDGNGVKLIPHQASQDRTPPEVNFVSPAADAVMQPLSSRIGVTVTDSLDYTTVNASTFVVRPVGGSALEGTYTYSRNYLNFTPEHPLQENTTYEVVLVENGITDLTGNGIKAFTSYFSTGPEIIISQDPDITILSPTNGAQTAETVTVTLQVRNWFGEGEWLEYSLDGNPPVNVFSAQPIELTGLSAGNHSLTLRLVDQDGGSPDQDEVEFSVDPLFDNQAPVVVLESDRTLVEINDMVFLDASASTDPDQGPSALTFTWSQLSGPMVTFQQAQSASTLVQLSEAGTYEFQVTVSDGHRSSSENISVLAQIPGNDLIIVSSSSNLTATEQAMRTYLQAKGWEVSHVNTNGLSPQAVAGNDLVLISSSVNSGQVTSKIRDVEIPIVVWESYVYDAPDLGMVTGAANTSYGNSASQSIEIPDTVNALNQGFSGRLEIFDSEQTMAWGVPGDQAMIGATLPNTNQALLFGYDIGVHMPGGIAAPHRRVGIFLYDTTFTQLNETGLALFDQALLWAAGQQASTPLTLETSSLPLVQTGVEVSLRAEVSGGQGTVEYSWDVEEPDGTRTQTAWSSSPEYVRSFSEAWNHNILLRVRDRVDEITRGLTLEVYSPAAANEAASASTVLMDEVRNQAVVVNPDNHSISFVNLESFQVQERTVAPGPRSLTLTGNGELWVVSSLEARISIFSTASKTLIETIELPYGSAPSAVISDPDGQSVYVALEGSGKLLRYGVSDRSVRGSLDIGSTPRGLAIDPGGEKLYVARFISPEEEGRIEVVDLDTYTQLQGISLRISDVPDTHLGGSGLPNYLGWMDVHPDGSRLLVPAKQDNIGRGSFRNGIAFTPENVVRNMTATLNLDTASEIYAKRMDINDSEGAAAAVYSPRGNHAFVSLRGNNRVLLMDAPRGGELMRFSVGAAPTGLGMTSDDILVVHNYLDRSLSVFDVGALLLGEEIQPQLLATVDLVSTEQLPEMVLAGKQVFYNAVDERMSANAYISCATCHLDGGQDGRVWDFTDRGEGLRNTIDLRGRAGTAHGRMHWSANFDEVQDFENDIRNHFGGLGFLSDSDFEDTQQTLGAAKAGLSVELEQLRAYLESLDRVPDSPHREADGSMSVLAQEGEKVFRRQDCASCHSGEHYTDSSLSESILHNVGTLSNASGQRLGSGALPGVDTPSLRGLWNAAPYFHDGSAADLNEVIQRSSAAHGNLQAITEQEKAQLIAYLLELDANNGSSPENRPPVINSVEMNPSTVSGTTSQLSVSAYDPDDEPVRISWQGSGPKPVVLSHEDASSTQVTFQGIGNYRFDIQVQDPRGNQSQSHISGQVTPTASSLEILSQPME